MLCERCFIMDAHINFNSTISWTGIERGEYLGFTKWVNALVYRKDQAGIFDEQRAELWTVYTDWEQAGLSCVNITLESHSHYASSTTFICSLLAFSTLSNSCSSGPAQYNDEQTGRTSGSLRSLPGLEIQVWPSNFLIHARILVTLYVSLVGTHHLTYPD